MKRILAADIGGTHSRFGYFKVDEKGELSLVETQWIDTAKASSFSHLLELLQKTPFSLLPEQSDIAVLAVAGPVTKGGSSNPPNIDWSIDVSNSAEDFKLQRCRLINDFPPRPMPAVRRRRNPPGRCFPVKLIRTRRWRSSAPGPGWECRPWYPTAPADTWPCRPKAGTVRCPLSHRRNSIS